MDFSFSPELSELQSMVRRLAREKVGPRAREIDKTGQYPKDLFELFRDAGLLGLCIPEELGGSGAGITGLTIAIEEVAKYSNAAALMLLLTRLPTGPVLIGGPKNKSAGTFPRSREAPSAPLSACRNPRREVTSWGCAPRPPQTPTSPGAG